MATLAVPVHRRLTTAAIAPMRRLPTTTTDPRGATTQLPTVTIPRRAATTRLPTETIRRRVPILRLRLTPLHAAAVPRRAVTPRPRLAPLVVDLAVDSTAVAVADPTVAEAAVVPTAAGVAVLTAAVVAAPTVAVVATNPRIAQVQHARSAAHGAGFSVEKMKRVDLKESFSIKGRKGR